MTLGGRASASATAEANIATGRATGAAGAESGAARAAGAGAIGRAGTRCGDGASSASNAGAGGRIAGWMSSERVASCARRSCAASDAFSRTHVATSGTYPSSTIACSIAVCIPSAEE